MPNAFKSQKFSDDVLNAFRRIRDARSGHIGNLGYRIGSKSIDLNGYYGNLSGSGQIEYDGDWRLDLSAPFAKGNMNIEAQNRNNNSEYYLRYLRRF